MLYIRLIQVSVVGRSEPIPAATGQEVTPWSSTAHHRANTETNEIDNHALSNSLHGLI